MAVVPSSSDLRRYAILTYQWGVDPLEDSPSIEHQFEIDYRNSESGIVIYKNYGFWIGLVAPAIPAIALFIWFIIAGGDLDDLIIFQGFLCSTCFWPVIGFNLAKVVNISQNLNAGLRISAKIGIIFGIIIWLGFISLIGNGITN